MAPLIQHLDALLSRRQETGPPEDNSDQSASSSELSGGAIAGIVIGSIVGILLLWWIFRSCGFGFGYATGPKQPPRSGYYHYEKSPRGRSRSSQRRHRHHHHHHHSSPRRSSSLRPVVVETSYDTVPRAPPAAYGYQTQATRGYDDGYAYKPRSHSRRSRY